MGDRRMFSKKVVETDRFLDLPLSAQALYFHIGLNADDEGFIGNSKSIQRMIGASNDDMRLLQAKGLVQIFESGVAHITDWSENNYIQKDRRKATIYLEEKNSMSTSRQPNDSAMDTECIQVVYKTDTQVKLSKDKLSKDKLNKESTEETPARKKEKPQKHRHGKFKNVLLTDEELEKLREKFPDTYEAMIDRLSYGIESKGYKYKSHYATILNWYRRDTEEKEQRQHERARVTTVFEYDPDELPF